MAITYDKIEKEIQCISEETLNASREVPSVFNTVKLGLIPATVYFSFYFLCALSEVFIENIWLLSVFCPFSFGCSCLYLLAAIGKCFQCYLKMPMSDLK